MTLMAEPFDGIVIYGPLWDFADGTHGIGPVRGTYVRGARAIEGLDVIRMEWSHEVPHELRLMEGRRVRRPKK